MASVKTAKHKKTAASRSKAPSKSKTATRRATSSRKTSTSRKPASRPVSTAKRKASPARDKISAKSKAPIKAAKLKAAVKKPVKKSVAKQLPPKKAMPAKPAAKVMKAVSAESVKKMMKVQVEAAQKQKAKAEKEAAKKAAAKPVATVHKFMPRPGASTLNGKSAMPQPPVKMSNFSTTASPVKSAGNSKVGFKVNEYIVYPTHGVGQITAIEEQLIAGLKLELFVVFFAKDRMTLRVPVGKIASVGLRKISESGLVARSMETLKGRPRIKRTMWSRRAQEYEAKINSGDLISVAEVVRDLYRAETQPEQSYSERQLYESALDRMVREVAVVHKSSDSEAQHMIETALQKSPRRARTVAGEENVVAFKKPADNDDRLEEKAA